MLASESVFASTNSAQPHKRRQQKRLPAGNYREDPFRQDHPRNLQVSPFYHRRFVPKDFIELWARVFARVGQGLIDALDYSGPDRGKKVGTAARWYLGLP